MKKNLLGAALFCLAALAPSPKTWAQNAATPLEEALQAFCQKHGEPGKSTYKLTRNPETSLIESRVSVTPFTCPNEQEILDLCRVFTQCEPQSFLFVRLQPGDPQLYNILTGNSPNEYLQARSDTQESYISMNMKNKENPRLRDNYTMAWKQEENGEGFRGKVFRVTSLRSDLIEKRQAIPPIEMHNLRPFLEKYQLKEHLEEQNQHLQDLEEQLKQHTEQYALYRKPWDSKTMKKRMKRMNKRAKGMVKEIEKKMGRTE